MVVEMKVEWRDFVFQRKVWEGNLVQRNDHHFPLAVTALGCARMFSTQVRILGVLWCSYFMNTIQVFLFSYPHCYSQITTVTFRILLFPHNNRMTWKAAPWAYAGEPAVWLKVTTEEMVILYLTLHVGWTWHLISLKHVLPYLLILARFTGFDAPPSVLFVQDMQLPDVSGPSTFGRNPSLWRGTDTMPCGKTVSWDKMQTNCFLFARWCTVLFFSSHSWMLASHLSRHLLKMVLRFWNWKSLSLAAALASRFNSNFVSCSISLSLFIPPQGCPLFDSWRPVEQNPTLPFWNLDPEIAISEYLLYPRTKAI